MSKFNPKADIIDEDIKQISFVVKADSPLGEAVLMAAREAGVQPNKLIKQMVKHCLTEMDIKPPKRKRRTTG